MDVINSEGKKEALSSCYILLGYLQASFETNKENYGDDFEGSFEFGLLDKIIEYLKGE